MDIEYTQQFTEAFGLDKIPEDERDRLYIAMGEVVHRAVMRRVWMALALEEQDELSARMDAERENPDNDAHRLAVQAYIREHVPDLETYVAEEIDALKEAQERAYGEMTS